VNLLIFDFETYWSQDYTLTKMNPAEYILDPRFEPLGCAFKWGAAKPFWVDKPHLPAFYASVDWSTTFAVSHNALFDACILSWRYGVRPAGLGDTMAMMRNWWSYKTDRISLATMAKHLGHTDKMNTAQKTKGKTYEQVVSEPALHEELKLYGCDDCDIAYEGFSRMMGEGFPPGQLEIIDRQIRMASEPNFVLNQNVLALHYDAVTSRKHALLNSIGFDPAETTGLQSNERFALLLQSFGVSPPRKISKATGKETWAFAKTDAEFTSLDSHPDPMVQALIAARLGVKSTIEETRTLAYMNIGNLNWGHLPAQTMPIPLKYSGAHTHRFSGDWQLNAQNIGRESPIRQAVEAPQGKVVLSVDASQVEARIVATLAMWLAKQQSKEYSKLVEYFDKGRDVYSAFAGLVFNDPTISKATHPVERFIGKTAVLSLGYNSSWVVFQNMVRIQSKSLPTGVIQLGDGPAQKIVDTYRSTFHEIPRLWRFCNNTIIPFMGSAKPGTWMQLGPCWVGYQVIVLPNGNRINYRNLFFEMGDDGLQEHGEWWYEFGNRRYKLYGAKVVENITQALAFLLIMEADRRIKHRSQGLLRLAHQVHDELIYVVPEHWAESVKALAIEEVSRRPDFMPDLPLASECNYGRSYAAAKGN